VRAARVKQRASGAGAPRKCAAPTWMDIGDLKGLNELAAACTGDEGGRRMAVMTGLSNEVSRKRRRAPAAASTAQACSVEEHLAALRMRWQVRPLGSALRARPSHELAGPCGSPYRDV